MKMDLTSAGRDPAGGGHADLGPRTWEAAPMPAADARGPGGRAGPLETGEGAERRTSRLPQPVQVPVWPLLVLALPAFVAVWSGWVGLGEMAGFGDIHPLPGVWNSAHLDTAITLAIGVEAYAAIALRAWLTSSEAVSARTRVFARWSAISALVLGATGQIAYHLLQEAHVTRAPWSVTTLVSSLPVMVLGAGTALAHMLRADAVAVDENQETRTAETAVLVRDRKPGWQPDVDFGEKRCDEARDSAGEGDEADQLCIKVPGQSDDGIADDGESIGQRLHQATVAAGELIAAGQRVSRRTLRAAGIRGSNAELNLLAQQIRRSAA